METSLLGRAMHMPVASERATRVLSVTLLLAGLIGAAHADSLNPEIATRVRGGTFELVAPIGTKGGDGVVGTAFAIGPNAFVSAAHSFDQVIGSRYGRPMLVDARRAGHEIAQILAFSQSRDYVVFSLVHPPAVAPLNLLSVAEGVAAGPAASAQDARNARRPVYFVGRQRGGGLVIEPGTVTGTSRDEDSGTFDWLRFEGRVWQGVSGAPLIDADGNVVGMVRARPREGNENYAVPIALIAAAITPSRSQGSLGERSRDAGLRPGPLDPASLEPADTASLDEGSLDDAAPLTTPTAPTRRAELHVHDPLRPLDAAAFAYKPFDGEVALPRLYDPFAREVVRLRAEYVSNTLGPLVEATSHHFLLAGRGAAGMCDFLNAIPCECRAAADASGMLMLDEPQVDATLRKVSERRDVSERIAGVVVVRIANKQWDEARAQKVSRTAGLWRDARTRKPSQTTADPPRSALQDSLIHLNLALKGQAASEHDMEAITAKADIEVADLEQRYTDFSGRAWIARTWPLADHDLKVVSLARETAGGYVVLMRTVPTALTTAALLQQEFVSNLTQFACNEAPDLDIAQAEATKTR